jgi:hypothetical protein
MTLNKARPLWAQIRDPSFPGLGRNSVGPDLHPEE